MFESQRVRRQIYKTFESKNLCMLIIFGVEVGFIYCCFFLFCRLAVSHEDSQMRTVYQDSCACLFFFGITDSIRLSLKVQILAIQKIYYMNSLFLVKKCVIRVLIHVKYIPENLQTSFFFLVLFFCHIFH